MQFTLNLLHFLYIWDNGSSLNINNLPSVDKVMVGDWLAAIFLSSKSRLTLLEITFFIFLFVTRLS